MSDEAARLYSHEQIAAGLERLAQDRRQVAFAVMRDEPITRKHQTDGLQIQGLALSTLCVIDKSWNVAFPAPFLELVFCEVYVVCVFP